MREQYAAFGRLTDSLRAAQDRADRARAALDRARRDVRRRAATAYASGMRQWEDSTYEGYDSIVQGLARQAGREPVTDTTGRGRLGRG